MTAHAADRPRNFLILTVLTTVGILVHGYHPGAEDDAIYLPAIKKILDPALYPSDTLFFMEQTRLTLFDEIVALLVRVSHLSVEVAVFLLHCLSIFLLLLGCLRISRRCFQGEEARWASVMTVTALLTLPVSGTALYIMDFHLHPRSLAACAILFAIVAVLDMRLIAAVLFIILAAVIHPLMAAFGAAFIVFLAWKPVPPTVGTNRSALFASGLAVNPDSPVWREIRLTRRHHYLLQWTWYEWLGIIAPLVMLFSMSAVPIRGTTPTLAHVSRRLALFGLCFLALALATTLPTDLARLGPFQPMRHLHLVYLFLFLFAGGLIGQFILKRRPVRWVLFFLPLCLVMATAQRNCFPSTEHIVWPWTSSRNPWIQAFDWIRQNTPRDALFALNPHHMRLAGEDFHGFRALAERSMLADLVKDPGVVAESFALEAVGNKSEGSLPKIADAWYRQTSALQGWKDFGADDFRRLRDRLGVTWVVVEGGVIEGMACPYSNGTVAVCRLE